MAGRAEASPAGATLERTASASAADGSTINGGTASARTASATVGSSSPGAVAAPSAAGAPSAVRCSPEWCFHAAARLDSRVPSGDRYHHSCFFALRTKRVKPGGSSSRGRDSLGLGDGSEGRGFAIDDQHYL